MLQGTRPSFLCSLLRIEAKAGAVLLKAPGFFGRRSGQAFWTRARAEAVVARALRRQTSHAIGRLLRQWHVQSPINLSHSGQRVADQVRVFEINESIRQFRVSITKLDEPLCSLGQNTGFAGGYLLRVCSKGLKPL